MGGLHVCAAHECSAKRDQKIESDPLGQETVGAATWVLEIKPGSSRRGAGALNH